MQIIPHRPLPRLHLLHAQSTITISQRRIIYITRHHKRHNRTQYRPAQIHSALSLSGNPLTNRRLPVVVLALCRGILARTISCEANRGLSVQSVGQGCTVDVGLDVADELEEGAGDEGGGEVSGEVVVEEELATHYVEGDVVGCPG